MPDVTGSDSGTRSNTTNGAETLQVTGFTVVDADNLVLIANLCSGGITSPTIEWGTQQMTLVKFEDQGGRQNRTYVLFDPDPGNLVGEANWTTSTEAVLGFRAYKDASQTLADYQALAVSNVDTGTGVASINVTRPTGGATFAAINASSNVTTTTGDELWSHTTPNLGVKGNENFTGTVFTHQWSLSPNGDYSATGVGITKFTEPETVILMGDGLT